MSEDSANPYQSPVRTAAVVPAKLPRSTLFRDRSFWGLTITQFLGAFNDNLYKQILLLLFVAVPLGSGKKDLQWLATLMFSIPFIFLSGIAGYLSDRYSKRRIIIVCKLAEFAIMGIGALLFYFYGQVGMAVWLLVAMTVTLAFMGSHTAMFGPSKYGILPEILSERDLPNANGFILMTTFIAIIFGSALAGGLLDSLHSHLWVAGCICMAIALLGAAAALLLRPTPPAIPDLAFDWSTLWVPQAIRQYLAVDRGLLAALIVSSIFWMIAAVVQMAVNALGKLQFQETSQRTSLMIATISIGIAVGSVIAGALSHERFNTAVLKTGVWGMVICLALLSVPANNADHHLLGYYGSIVCLVALGAFTGMFAVPLQVFIQVRPPPGLKGRMIATQNLWNWIGITLSAAVYYGLTELNKSLKWQPAAVFGVTAAVMLLVAILYRPQADRIDWQQ